MRKTQMTTSKIDIYDDNFRRETETALFLEGQHFTVDIEKIETLNTICKG